MGLLLSSMPLQGKYRPDSTYIGGPTVRTPLTGLNAAVGSWEGTECEPFEIRLFNCAEAYGMIRSKEKCKLLFQDFQECAQKMGQVDRLYVLQQERKKQFAKGLFGLGPRVPFYAPSARNDAYGPDPFEDMGLGY